MRLHPSELKIGDIVYECEYGMCIEVEITTQPKSKIVRIEGDELSHITWEWKAVVSDGGEPIDYLSSENHPHYSPQIYREKQYTNEHRKN